MRHPLEPNPGTQEHINPATIHEVYVSQESFDAAYDLITGINSRFGLGNRSILQAQCPATETEPKIAVSGYCGATKVKTFTITAEFQNGIRGIVSGHGSAITPNGVESPHVSLSYWQGLTLLGEEQAVDDETLQQLSSIIEDKQRQGSFRPAFVSNV